MSRFAHLRHIVFGAIDGLTCAISAILAAAGHPQLALLIAVKVGGGEGVGMAVAEWLSDTESGVIASGMLGLATAAGTIAPAIPYALAPVSVAFPISIAIMLAIATGIMLARRGEHGWRRAILETYGLLAAVSLVVAVV